MNTFSSYFKQSQTIIRVDEKEKPIGGIDKWEAHKKGVLHKGFSVALMYNRQILLQIRKHPVFDKVVDLTASSHPLVIKGINQNEEDAVYDCLSREWNVQRSELSNFTNCGSFVYKAEDGAGYIEHEYCTFYKANIEREVKPNMEFAYGFIKVEFKVFKADPQMYSLAPWVKEGMHLFKI